MKVIHLLRKPLSEKTVAANTTKHGVGGLNIDASRIEGPAWTWGTQTDIRGGGYGSKRPSDGDVFATNVQSNPKGRWPANLILQHLDGCRCEGVKRVKGAGWRDTDRRTTMLRGNVAPAASNSRHHVDKDGKESVANWICEPGCPIKALDEQSGVRAKGNLPSQQNTASWKMSSKGKNLTPEINYGDTGGASRFFKQVGGSKK